jgi:hypothetical protein
VVVLTVAGKVTLEEGNPLLCSYHLLQSSVRTASPANRGSESKSQFVTTSFSPKNVGERKEEEQQQNLKKVVPLFICECKSGEASCLGGRGRKVWAKLPLIPDACECMSRAGGGQRQGIPGHDPLVAIAQQPSARQ